MTVEQKQCLLKYLNYYSGAVDGDWGKKSKEATEDFQNAEGLNSDGVFGDATLKAAISAVANGRFKKTTSTTNTTTTTNKTQTSGTYWDEIKYFTRDEFRCPCGKCGGFPVEPKEALVRIVDEMRGAFGKAVIIVPPDGHSGGSGVRCQKYNDSLSGSATNSRHIQGKAVDFSAPGVSAAIIEAYLNKLLNAGKIRYWYKISSGSYHMDIN